MYKVLVLIVYFYAVTATAYENSESCLGIQREQDKLVFFYAKQDETDKPYFYAKVVTDENESSEITLSTLRDMKGYLTYLPPTDPHQYQLPMNARKLYVVSTKARLDGFPFEASVIPSIRGIERHVIDLAVKRKRNASNYPQPLPKETKKRNGVFAGNDVKICEFVL